MNEQDEIIEMARQAGFLDADDKGVWITDGYWTKELERFAKLIAAKEREACADIAENWNSNGFPRVGVAEQIRARGEA